MKSPTVIKRACFNMPRIAIINILLAHTTIVFAQSIRGTNETLPDSETKSSFVLRLGGSSAFDGKSDFDGKSYELVPLTVAAGKGQSAVAMSTYNIQGYFKPAEPFSNITHSDMAFLPCDSTDPTENSTEIMKAVTSQNPQAIILYSRFAEACSSSGDFGYQSIYSMTSRKDARNIFSSGVLNSSLAEPKKAFVTPSSATNFGNPVMDTNNEGGPAPTTAVAMSILYSITGIITLLFLVIIATGAIRAHRHPERYGPRNTGIPGRPRQSRAKGLARAMLETLPIIKFGDPLPLKEGANQKLGQDPSHTNLETLRSFAPESEERKTERVGPILNSSVESNHDTHEGDLGCSICTEDFIAGEDLRVLPCNHKYHPVCIDPWLLDVCGTCPLCRHDLRPINSNPTQSTHSSEPPPPLSAIDGNRYTPEDLPLNSRRNRITRIFDLHRLRQAPPSESIAALRLFRQQAQNVPVEPRSEETEERSRSANLAGRLRNTFRINTRTQTAEPILPP